MTLTPSFVGLMVAFCVMPGVVAQQTKQESMGSVSTADATIAGGLEVEGARARLVTAAHVTALDHTAQVSLDRGGLLQVCSTSSIHLLRSGTGDALLFTLDSGAMELHTAARAQDSILTPDLRFTMVSAGPLDLRMRVTREGDTCVDNRGAVAPVLQITEAFGDAQYRLAPGQHVLFEHGHLREVNDSERSDCGCPAAAPRMVGAGTTNATSVTTPAQVAAQNPFPVAQSAGLAPVSPTVPLPPSTATLAYDPAGTAAPAPLSAALAPPPSPVVDTAPPVTPPGAHEIAHGIRGFFHRLFHRHEKTVSHP